jgi:uncharacterized protein YjbI with pentapeptide repeats
LSGANLSGAYLFDARLEKANLQYANLQDADLREANLTDVNLKGANLTDAKFGRYTTPSFIIEAQRAVNLGSSISINLNEMDDLAQDWGWEDWGHFSDSIE